MFAQPRWTSLSLTRGDLWRWQTSHLLCASLHFFSVSLTWRGRSMRLLLEERCRPRPRAARSLKHSQRCWTYVHEKGLLRCGSIVVPGHAWLSSVHSCVGCHPCDIMKKATRTAPVTSLRFRQEHESRARTSSDRTCQHQHFTSQKEHAVHRCFRVKPTSTLR